MAAAGATRRLLLLACVAAVCSHHGAEAQGLPSIAGLASAATPKSRALHISSSFLAAYKLGNTSYMLQAFGAWKTASGVSYKSTAEERQRYANFVVNMLDIARINDRAMQGAQGFWAAPNKFSDLTFPEFSQKLLMQPGAFNPVAAATASAARQGLESAAPRLGRMMMGAISYEESLRRLMQVAVPEPPPSVNWQLASKVSPVKEQGSCGGCWAFTAVAAMESALMISHNSTSPPDLSEQQLLSCAAGQGYSSQGCKGGSAADGFNYAHRNNLTVEARYPYVSSKGTCRPEVATSPDLHAGTVNLAGPSKTVSPSKSAAALEAVVARQPVVVYFMVDSQFQHYAGGVYDAKTCTNYVNHAMLAVGYSREPHVAEPYWLLKNSWGVGWGEQQGYARVKYQPRAEGPGPCGMYQYAYYPSMQFTRPQPQPQPPKPARQPPSQQLATSNRTAPPAPPSPKHAQPPPSTKQTSSVQQGNSLPPPRAASSHAQSRQSPSPPPRQPAPSATKPQQAATKQPPPGKPATQQRPAPSSKTTPDAQQQGESVQSSKSQQTLPLPSLLGKDGPGLLMFG